MSLCSNSPRALLLGWAKDGPSAPEFPFQEILPYTMGKGTRLAGGFWGNVPILCQQKSSINKTGKMQFRVYFAVDDMLVTFY